MPVHDWSRVKAGFFHDFHNAWITHLKEALNAGLLPDGYYALGEQHAGRVIADVYARFSPPSDAGGVAVADAPPQVGRKMVAGENATYRSLRRTVAIRHGSGRRLVALVEIVSPANKDRLRSVEEFVEKATGVIRAGCHITMVDLFDPSDHDPQGMHGLIWQYFDLEDYLLPSEQPLTLASYCAADVPEAYLTHVAIGDRIPEMPLFLREGHYVNLPLTATYDAAFRGVPQYWQSVL